MGEGFVSLCSRFGLFEFPRVAFFSNSSYSLADALVGFHRIKADGVLASTDRFDEGVLEELERRDYAIILEDEDGAFRLCRQQSQDSVKTPKLGLFTSGPALLARGWFPISPEHTLGISC
jgi:hypothetical protein